MWHLPLGVQAGAHVEVDNPANDISVFAASCYSLLERSLARLEALSGVAPLCAARHQDLYT